MNNSITEQLLLLPGIEDFSEKFINSVAKFNQHIYRIRSLISFRNSLLFHDLDISWDIHEKFKKFKCDRLEVDGVDKFFEELKEFQKNGNITQKQIFVANELYKKYFNLHSVCIGTKDSGGLKEAFHNIYEEILTKERQLEGCFNFREGGYYLMVVLLYAFINIFWSLLFKNWSWDLAFQLNLFIYAIIAFLTLKLLKIIK
jgi:hypothetical protein